jgi:tetratricopeptide (TPR) repeat protein
MKGARILAAVALALLGVAARASGSFDEGERLFRADSPADAVPLLERAVMEAGVDERAWLYLGLSYQLLGRYDEAASVLRKGLPSAQRFRHLFYFDLGNVFVLQGKNAFAADMFGEALAADSAYAPAYLNRANARLGIKDFTGAAADYRKYLDLDPGSSQRDSIERLIEKLGTALAEIDRQKAVAEAKRLTEETARKTLLDQVTSSLKAAADETKNLSAGSGPVQGYEDEPELAQ